MSEGVRSAAEARGMTVPSTEPYFPPASRQRLHAALDEVLTGRLSRGPRALELERRFAEYVGVRHAVSTSSGAGALFALLSSIDLDGGEVIVPTMTCFACASTVLLAGGRPRIVDIDPETMCIDFADTEKSIGASTRAIMLVHLAGQIVPDLAAFRELAAARGLHLIEDAAQATGAALGDRRAGSLVDAAIFSFHPTKIITTGEGGMITTDDDALAGRCRRFREGGADVTGGEHASVGMNLRMDELSAALGLEQLAHLDDFVARRNEVVDRYDELLGEVAGAGLLPIAPACRSSRWKVYVRLDDGVDRDALATAMAARGVDVWPAYRPMLHGQPALAHLVPDPTRFARAQAAMDASICLPISATMTKEEIDHVVACLRECL